MLSGISPAKIRPGRPIYGPEALLRNIELKAPLNTSSPRAQGAPGGPTDAEADSSFFVNSKQTRLIIHYSMLRNSASGP